MARVLPIALLTLVLTSGVVQSQAVLVRVTWYAPTGRPMANGQMPYHGAAACSWNWEIGTRLQFPDGLVVTCADRGLLGGWGWVDLYAPTPAIGREYARRYGDYVRVEVLDRLDAAAEEDDS